MANNLYCKKGDLISGTERHLNIHDFDNRNINLKLNTLPDWTTTDIDFLHDSPEQLYFSNIGIEYNEGDNIIQNIFNVLLSHSIIISHNNV